MKEIRTRIEKGFERLGEFIIRFRWGVLALTFLLTAVMVLQIPKTTFNMDTEAFLQEDDPSILKYDEFRDQFGRDEMIVVMISPENVFDQAFLTKLKAFHEQLEEQVPHLNDITSLVNARLTRGEEGQLLVEDLMAELPGTEDELALLKARVLANPIYRNLLVSEDGKLTTVVIKSEAYVTGGDESEEDTGFDEESTGKANSIGEDERKHLSNDDNTEIVRSIRDVMQQFNSPDFPLRLSGSPVVTDYLKAAMQGDMMKFTRLAIIAIALFLFLLFRRVSGVLLPLLTVVLSVIFTFGMMAATGTPITLPLAILPSFILATGVGASVHIMAIFFKYYRTEDKPTAIVKTLGHSGLPIAMTSITTSAGLLSFLGAELAPASDLGIFASFGMLASFTFSVCLIPALLSIFPVKPQTAPKSTGKNNPMDRILLACGNFAVDQKWKVTIVAIVLVFVAGIGISQLRPSHDVLYWFKKGTEIRDNTDLIDSKMKGTLAIEVVIDTGVENGLFEPVVLNGLEKLAERLMAYKGKDPSMFVGKTISLVDMLKEINQALHENQIEHYAIPQDRQLIAQEFLLFENSGSDDLEDIVDSRFSKTHLTAKVPWNDSVNYVHFVNYVESNVEEIFGDKYETAVTGLIQMMMKTVSAMMSSTFKSYGIAVVIITILMILLLGRFRIGVLSMIPNLFPILLILGLMGWTGIKLDMFTMLIGSIAIGLAVDDTIHFFHNFRIFYEESGNVRNAVLETLTTAGRAMLVTTVVLAVGFWLFMFASMNHLFNFGLLTGTTLVFAFLADILLAPALLAIVTPDKKHLPLLIPDKKNKIGSN